VLRRKIEDNLASQGDEQRNLASLAEEKQRINQRFDEELIRLQVLWAPQGLPGAPAAAGR
jgi:hypothetical protein